MYDNTTNNIFTENELSVDCLFCLNFALYDKRPHHSLLTVTLPKTNHSPWPQLYIQNTHKMHMKKNKKQWNITLKFHFSTCFMILHIVAQEQKFRYHLSVIKKILFHYICLFYFYFKNALTGYPSHEKYRQERIKRERGRLLRPWVKHCFIKYNFYRGFIFRPWTTFGAWG